MPDVHAVLSASASHRWINCPGSIHLTKDLPDSTSQFAEEGTTAHKLAELYLNYDLKLYKDKKELKEREKELDEVLKSPYYSKDMNEYVTQYVSTVFEYAEEAKKISKDAVIMTEHRLDFSEWVPDGFGTGDMVIIADGIVHIIDLKYGKGVAVSAIDNPQLRLYGLGAIDEFDALYGIRRVRLTIIQPRLDSISTEELPVEDLLKWGEEIVKPAAKVAMEEDAPCTAGDWCKFCKVKATCRARAEYMLELAKLEFKDAKLLQDDEIGEVLKKAEQLQNWVSAVQEYALEQATVHGKKYKGWKVVEGRSNRKYADDAKVIEALTGAGFAEATLFERKLYGITDMEKIVGKKKLTEVLGDLIVKPEGKPTLVEESDKRPELSSAESAKADFS